MKNYKLIKSEKEYEAALKDMQKIFNAKKNTPDGDKLELLSLLIHNYENKHWKIKPLSALEAIQHELEERQISQTHLAKSAGYSKSTISEILSGKKQMSVRFLKFLNRELGVPAQILLN